MHLIPCLPEILPGTRLQQTVFQKSVRVVIVGAWGVGDSSHTVQFQFSIPSSFVFLLARNCIHPAGSAAVLA